MTPEEEAKLKKGEMEKGVVEAEISEEMKSAYIDYAMSVIVSRAIPAVEDGLKPVHRRILYAMSLMGLHPNTPTRKSARIVGECFVKDTQILTTRGLLPIQEIERGEFVYTHKGIQEVTELYEMPEKELVKVTLNNGTSVTATQSQKFKVLNKNLEYEWKEAQNLKDGDFVVVKSVYPEINNFVCLGELNKKKIYLNENIGYLLGQLLSDDWVEKGYNRGRGLRCGFCSSSISVINKIIKILKEEFDYEAKIEKRANKSTNENGQVLINKLYSVRINRSEINEFLTGAFSLQGAYASTKIIPKQIFTSPKSIIFALISGMIDGDGCIKLRNIIDYTSISEKLIDQLLLIMHHLGIIGRKYKLKSKEHLINGKVIKSNFPSYHIEINGEFSKKLAYDLSLEDEKKKERLKILLSKKGGKTEFEIIPFLGKVVFSELSKNHLGGGWYKDKNGKKFRAGIKYPGGCKIRYSKDLKEKELRKSQLIEWNILEKLKRINSKDYDFIKEVFNNNLFFIQIKKIEKSNSEKTYDIQVRDDHEFIANGFVSHNCMGKFHPHGDIAIYDALVRMAQDFSLRYPLIEGQGNFGCFTADTKVALTDGRNLSFKELVKEYEEGKENFCYTIKEDGRIGIAKIKNPRITKRNAEVIKVILDNGEEIICTPDHRFMLRNGTYRGAKDLTKEDSLMPFQMLEAVQKYNHKIKRIKRLNERTDVYDLEVPGTHNFSLAAGVFVHNSIDNDPPAAMRYTECKLAKISEELLQDLDKETVDFIPNFDNSMEEPVILPGKLPNLLLNGASGIAVGMATNMPPHNLTDVTNACIAYIEKPEITVEKLAEIIQGPDFPTGGQISRQGILDLYTKGRGSMIVKGRTALEKIKSKEAIIITELPYQTNKAKLIEKIADLMKDKKLPDISDIRDESAKGKVRIVIELKKGSNPQFTMNRLYEFTDLQTKFDGIMLALDNGQPKVMDLKHIIKAYVEHRKKIVLKRTKYEHKVASERQHITEGLLIALKDVDALVNTIRKSANTTAANETLQAKYKLSKKQAEAILEMKLSKLTSLEMTKLKDENDTLIKKIKELLKIMGSPEEILGIIRKEILELRRVYGDSRRTSIFERVKELTEKDLVAKKDVVITITSKGYVKRIDIRSYQEQKRGGKGAIGADLATGDFVKQILTCSTHDYLLLFTTKGKLFWLKAYEIPEVQKYGKGKALINILNITDEVTAVLPVKEFKGSLFMATEKGIVKRVNMEEFSNPRKGGVQAMKLENDRLIDVELINGDEDIMMATKQGTAIRFPASEVREMGRAAYGVTGIKLEKDDLVVGVQVVPKDEKARKEMTILTVTENGYGKRTTVEDYRTTGRAGKGVINISCDTSRNGLVIGIEMVRTDDSIIVTSSKGIVIRTPVKDIREMGRNTQGVKIIKLANGDKATSVVKVQRTADGEEAE